jgi:hypothetical protein
VPDTAPPIDPTTPVDRQHPRETLGMTTAWETYLETDAADDAMTWWHNITDQERVDIFAEHAPVDAIYDRWIDERVAAVLALAAEEDR